LSTSETGQSARLRREVTTLQKSQTFGKAAFRPNRGRLESEQLEDVRRAEMRQEDLALPR